MNRIAVIGGGAAGMIAAIAAAEYGAQPTIYEKNDRLGRKLMATGNGRCNITNRSLLPDEDEKGQPNVAFLYAQRSYHGSGVHLLETVFREFGYQETEDFFLGIGIPFRYEESRCYPYNLQASSVQDALRDAIARRNVAVRLEDPVHGLRKIKSGYRVTSAKGEERYDAVILCAGGKASPRLSSDGAGFPLCKQLQIPVTRLSPSLVKLKLDFPYCKRLSGLRFTAGVQILSEGKIWRQEQDEVIFTDDGISGTAIFQISGTASRLRMRGAKPLLRLDQFPEWTEGAFSEFLEDTVWRVGYKTVVEALNGLLHKKMIPVVLLICGIDRERVASTLKPGEIRKIAHCLKSLEIPITGDGGFANAQVTIGGISGEAIRSDLGIKGYPGLYAAGEMVDMDGDCGGYNLQWAWSSGYMAGKHAAVEGTYKEGSDKP